MEERRAISATPWPGRQSHPHAISPGLHGPPADATDLPARCRPGTWPVSPRPHRTPRPAPMPPHAVVPHADAGRHRLPASPRGILPVRPGRRRRAVCARSERGQHRARPPRRARSAAGLPLRLRAFWAAPILRPSGYAQAPRVGACSTPALLAGIIHESGEVCGPWRPGTAGRLNQLEGRGTSRPTCPQGRQRGRRSSCRPRPSGTLSRGSPGLDA
jgi:hypothetical protein